MKFLSDGEETTLSFAEKFASSLKGGEIILLDGRLGAGKTVFVKGIAKGLDIDEEVTSPTFTLMNEYQGRLSLVHMDVYRLKSALEAYEAGLTEYFGESLLYRVGGKYPRRIRPVQRNNGKDKLSRRREKGD